MGKQVVQVNGKAYDAITGRRIDDVVAPKKPVKHTPVAVPVVAPVKKPIAAKRQAARETNHVQAHQPEHAITLMRHGVKRPEAGLKKQAHPQHELIHGDTQTITVRHTAAAIDPARQQRAKQTERHDQVQHFQAPEPVKATLADVPVRRAPVDKPAIEPPVAPPPLPTNKPTDMFEQAIENANHYVDVTARKIHLKKKARRHLLSMSAGTLALMLIAAFAVYQNTPGLQIKVAGIKAGVATATPNFTASGLAYNGTHADQSRLIIGLKNGAATYQLSEEATSWSGDEMIDHVSAIDARGNANYTTVQSDSTAVYRFGDQQATWIKDGVWYHLYGNQGISNDQLLSLVQNT